MPKSPMRDLLVGIFVLAGLLSLGYLSLQLGGTSYTGKRGLVLEAAFDEIGKLSPRAPVVIGGVKVGQITEIRLDTDEFRAVVTLDIDSSLEIPDDSSASILTQGVLGDMYLEIEPGGSDEILRSGDEIPYTQSAVVLERLIGRLITNFGAESE